MKIYMISPSGKVTEVVPAKGKLTTIKQVNGSKLQFVDDAPTDTPKVIKTKKIGDNLELFTNNTEIADIVVENYFIDAQAMPTIFNENIGLTTEVGSITLESTVNPIFIASVEGASASMIAGVVLGVGGVAAMASGGSGSSTITTNTTPSSVEIVNKDGFTSGTASAKVTLGSSVHAGDTITIVLKATNGTTNDTSDDTTLATYIHTVTSGDLSAGYFSQTLAQETASDVYTVETTINATQLGTKHLTVSVDGVLSDDYLAYSTVFIDTNNDGKLDWTDANNDGQWQEGEGEAWTTTDSSGHFSFTIDPNGAPIVAIGGVDTASGNPNNIVYKMFSSATSSVDGVDIVISPLSTIIAAIIEKNAAQNGTTGQAVTEADVLAAVSTVASAFGLTVSDPKTFLTYDVVKETQAEASSYNNELLTLSREIAVVLSTTSALIDGAVSTTTSSISGSENFGTGTTAAASAFADLIVNKVASGDTVSLTMPADVESIMNSAMTKANEIIQNTDIQITASIPADIVTLSTLISSFNQQVSDLTATNGAQDITVINTLRAVIDTVVPALSQAGAEAATDRGGDISLSSAISTLNSAINNDIPTYITQQVTAVEAKTEQFLANDVSGTAEQLSKIVLQMPSLGVGDTIDTLTISTTLYKYIEKDASTQPDKVVTGELELWTVNPVTKQATHLIASEDGYYHLDPAIAGYLYVKTVDAIDCYLDVKATNTVDNTETDYSGAVKIHMEPAVTIISPTLAVTAVTDDFGTVTGVITKNGQTNDATPTVSGTITFPILSDGQAYLASYKVAIYDGGAYLGLATVQNDGTWSFTSPVLSPDGVKNIVARIVVGIDDANGSDFVTHYATAPHSFTLDTVTEIPTINPTDGKLITGIAEAGATVTVKNEAGTQIGTAVADATGKWSLSIATQLADTSKIKAVATDVAGNTSGESALTTVEWNTPTTLVTITSVTDNVGVVGGTPLATPVKLVTSTDTSTTYTNDATPTFTGTLSDALIDGESLKIYDGSTFLGTATVTGTSWTFTPAASGSGSLTDGTHVLTAQVENGSNSGKPSDVFGFSLDTVVPAQTLTLESVNDNVSEITGDIKLLDVKITNDSKPTFSGHLNSALLDNESVVAYYLDANGKSVRLGTATMDDAKTTGTFTPTIALPDGLNKVYFQIEDKAGNVSQSTMPFEFTVDTIVGKPTIDMTQPHMSTLSEEAGTVVCTMLKPSGEATTLSIDSASGDGSLFTIDENGVVHAVGLDFESKTSYTFTVLATDAAGNAGKKTVTITATDVQEADSIISIQPSTLETVNTPMMGETVTLEFVVTRTDLNGDAEVNWSVSGLSALDFADGILPTGTLFFGERELSATITVEVPASLTLEAIRHVGVSIETASDNYRVDLANSTAVIDVVDNATVQNATERYSVVCDKAVVSEGAEGDVTALTYTVKLLAGAGTGIGYTLQPMGSSLVTPDDFCDAAGEGLTVLPTGDISFENGEATVVVYVRGDNAVGPNEQFQLVLTGVSNTAVITGDAIAAIQNDDAYITVTPREISNVTSGEVTHEFVITRSGNTTQTHTVTYTISAVGENGTDIFDTEDPITITFAPGDTEVVITKTTTGTEVINGYKSFGIELSAGDNVTLLNSTAMSTILPNVQDVEITANIDRVLEGTETSFEYTITRSGETSEALDLPWFVRGTDENGASATDFLGGAFPQGTIHFEAGSQTATVSFKSSADTTLEGDEGFELVLDDSSLPAYIRLINPSIQGAIVDDESAVGFATNSTFEVVEGDSGTADLVVTVSRVGFTGNASTVDWALSFGTGEGKATLADLMNGQATSGTVTFRPGESTAVITLKVASDVAYENGLDESLSVSLSNPSNGTKLIGQDVEFPGYAKTTTATIINDDSLISVSTPTFSDVEGQGGTSKYMEITIKREGSTVGSDWVKWSLTSQGDNAVNNTDLGQENDLIAKFTSYDNSWIDLASMSGMNSANGSISVSKDGYIMVSYNRDWSYGDDNLPFDQFLLKNLSVEGGTLSALGSLVNKNGVDSNIQESTIVHEGMQGLVYSSDTENGFTLPGFENGGNHVVISSDKSLGDWYFTVSGYDSEGAFISETLRGPTDGTISTSQYFTSVTSITREPAHVAIGLVSSSGHDNYDVTAIGDEVELPYGSGSIYSIGDWQYSVDGGMMGAENIGSNRVVIKSEADLSDTTFVIHGGISVGYIQNGYYEMGPTLANVTENGDQANKVVFNVPTHVNVEAVSMNGIMDEFFYNMSEGEFPFNATTNYFLVSGLDAQGHAYEEVVGAKDIFEVDFQNSSFTGGVSINSLVSNTNCLETTLLPVEGENAGRVALGFVMNGGYLSEATFTIIGKDAQGNDITDVIHGPSSSEGMYDRSTVLSNKYFASVSSIVSDGDASEVSLFVGLTKPVQTTGEFSVVYNIQACDADGEPLESFMDMQFPAEGAGRFEFTAPVTIEMQGANNGVAISDRGLTYVDSIDVIKTADDATIQIGYDSGTYYSEGDTSSYAMLIAANNGAMSGNVFFTYSPYVVNDSYNYDTGNPATYSGSDTAYAIFKLDVTGNTPATVNFDMEQLGRFGIDTGKLSYAPEGTFSTSLESMQDNEGMNLLIPALQSSVKITALDLSAFVNEDLYAMEDTSYFYINSIYKGDLYYNEGTADNPHWVQFWDHSNNVESYNVSIEEIEAGKLGYVGSMVELGVYAYDVDGSQLSWNQFETGVYTSISLDRFAGEYDLSSVSYVSFDSIPGDNFYVNISETDTPVWVSVWENEGYVSASDIANGKLAYLGSSTDFDAHLYDASNEELGYVNHMTYHVLSVHDLATDGEGGYTGYDVGADEIRIRDVYEGELFYNKGTVSEPEWISYWDYVNEYNNESDYFPIQDAIDGKFAYVGDAVSLRTRFYTDGDYETSIYPYIQASGGDAPSEIATQTGEVTLDGSGYIWLRYDNNENGGNDGADMAWINNLHIVDPAGHATIEVVGQKVIKDGVAHEQELGGAGTLQLDGIAVKNMPIIDENGNNLIAITTLKNGTMGTRSGTDIYVTDMNDNENDLFIDAAGLTTSTVRSGMSTLTALGANEAKSVVYDEAYGSDTMADRTISLVHGNLSSLASNAQLIDPSTLHTLSLEKLVSMIPYGNDYLAEYDYSIGDIYMLNLGYDNESTTLYFNSGSVENPNWVVWNGDDLLAQDIADGKLACSGDGVYLYGAGFSMSDSWGDDSYGSEIGEYMAFPSQIVTLDELSRAFEVAINDITQLNILDWDANDGDGDLYYNMGTAENPNWITFNDYNDTYEEYPVLTQQDILDGKLAYAGDYLSLMANFDGGNSYNWSDSIYAQMHTLTLGDLATAFGINAGDINYVELYSAYADENAYVNIGTQSAPEWVSMGYFTDEYGELSVNDILEGKVIYAGDNFQIEAISIYDKNGECLVNEGSAQIRSDFHTITLEDIVAMYGNSFSANDIASVYVNDWEVDNDLWYNYGTAENPDWEYYSENYPTMSAEDIAAGKFAYSGDYVQLCANVYDRYEDYLVDDEWGDYMYPVQPNPYIFDTIELYEGTDGTVLNDEPAFMHSIADRYEITSDDTASVLDDTITLSGELLTFSSTEDLSDRTITISGYVEGSEELVTETIEAGPNNSTVVSTTRFVSVVSIELSEGENDAELSVGTSIVYGDPMTIFAKASVADSDGSITITGLDANGEAKTVVYENVLDGLSKSMGEFSEIFALHTSGMTTGTVEFSAVAGDGFIDVALTGTRDDEGYIVFDEPQRITISNSGDSKAQNEEFRITGLDAQGNTIVEIAEGIMNGGAYVSEHYFVKVLKIEAGLLDGTYAPIVSIGTVGAPVAPEQAMSQYGGEVVVNDSVAVFDAPSQITFSSEDNLTSRVFTITGTDAQGQTIVENVTGANNGIAISSQKFMSVSSITVDEGSAGSVKVGYTTSGGMTDNFVITGSGTAGDPFVGYSTNTTEGTESDVLLFVNFNGSAPGSVKLSYDLAVQGAVNSDTLYVEYSSTITSLLQGKAYFEDGESETTILIPIAGDDTKEGDEGMSLTLVSGSTGTTIDAEHNTTDITILNDDDIVTLDATAKTVVEGNDDAHENKISFTITREDDVTDKEVFWSIGNIGGDGQAQSDDFAETSGSVIFAAGSKTATIDVYLKADRIYEGVETFSLVLDTPAVGSGYSLNNAVANGTITEDDVGVSIVATDTSKNETDGTVTHTFTVSRVGDTSQASAINWTVSGTSGNGDIDAYLSDFGSSFPTGSLSFAANDTSSQTITITTHGDNEMTGDRNFAVNLTNGTDDTSDIYAPTATGTVIEDDAVSLTIDQARHIENKGSEKTVTYTLTRADGTHAATYNWNVLLQGDGVNAIASAEDFSASQDALNSNSGLPSGSVTFAEGETTATITLKIANDDILEADEAFKLHFAGANASVAAAQDIMSYIVNDIVGYGIDVKIDGSAVENNSVVEGSGTDKTVTVTFMRAGDSSQSATLSYSIEGAGAHPIDANDFTGMDSLPTNVSVTFEPWQSAITKTFVLKADSLKEETESFKIVLKDGESSEVASQTIDVTSDDAGLVLQVDSGNVDEGSYASDATGDALYTPVTYTVYRSGDTTHASDVKWRVKTSEGITMDDFVGAADALGTNGGLPSGSISFSANDAAMSKTFTLNVKKDWLYEGLTPENLVVELYDASVGTDITTSTATTTITDDDKEVGFVSYTVDGGAVVNGINAVVTEGDPSTVTMVTDEWVVLTYNILRTGNNRDGSQTVTWSLAGEAFDGADAATVDFQEGPSYNRTWSSQDVIGFDGEGNKATSGTLVFNGNDDNAKTITIKVHKDHYQENPEAFKITLTSNTPGLSVSSTTGVARGTINDDDIALVLSSDSATRVVHSEGQLDAEGHTVYTEYTWKIERKGVAEAINLNWTIQGFGGNGAINAYYSDRYSSDGYGWSDGWIPAATEDTSDFEQISNTVHFTADDTYKYLTIRVVGDAVVEPTEAFRVVLTKPENVDDITKLGNYSGNPMTSYFEGVILRDEGRFGMDYYELDISSAVNFDNEDYSTISSASDAKLEGNSGYVSHFFKIYRDFTTSGDATIEWRVNGYVGGNTSDANGVYDNNPFLRHNIGVEANQDDFAPNQNALSQGNGMPSGVATIPDGKDYTIIEIKTSANVTAEDLKGYYIALSNPSAGSTLDADNQYGEGYIANDDNPLFSIGQIVHTNDTVASYGSQVVVEGDAVTYTVYRTGSTTYEAKVDWSVIFPDPIGGSSTTDTNSASNYTASAADFDTATLSGTLTFAAGQNSQTITLPIKNDGVKESWAEAFSVQLANARWGDTVPQNIKDAQTPAISQVAGTMESIIVDNSGATSLVSVSAVNNATGGYEGGLGGSNTITYTLTRTGDYSQAAQIGWTLRTPSGLGDYVSIDGDTTEATYTPPNSGGVSYAVGLVSFGAGEHEKTITLTYANDTVVEDNENFVFTLVDGKTVLEEGYTEWMAPWYYGTGSDTTANANNSGLYFLDASGRIPDSDDMYRDADHYTTTTTVKNDDGTIYINNTYSDAWNTYIGANLYEGDTGNTTFTASITRTGRIDHDITVHYQLVDSLGHAVDGASGTWALNGIADDADGNGEKTYTMSFDLGAANIIPEANKSYTLKLSNISDSNIYFKQNNNDGGAASRDIPVTVLNDDTVWSMTPGTLSQAESDDSATKWTFTITRPSGGNNYGGEASVTYQIVSNGANYTIDSSDIVGGTGERTVNFAAGQYSQVVTFNVTGDKIAERNESFNVELVSANHGVIHETDYKATYTIVNDDTTVEIHNATSVIEGDVDGAYLEFDVVRKGQIGNGSSTVNWAVQDDSATAADDLTAEYAKPGTLSFDAGSTYISEAITDGYGEQTQTVRVNIKGDTTVEAHQSLSVSLSGATDSDGIAAGKTLASGTILNDESVFTLSAGTAVNEGDTAGQKFTITRSALTGQPQTINWAVTSDGSSHAVDGSDGVLATGSVTFAPNEWTKEIYVTSTKDAIAELDEVFKFSIAVANETTGATISGNDYAYGVVLNDDAGTPTVSQNDSTISIDADASAVEGDSGTQYVAFTLTRGGTLTYDASVDWHIEIAGKTATAADFGGTLPSGTLTMPNGQTSFTINVPISGDSAYEGDETFTLVLDNPEPGLEITTATAVGTITNDDCRISVVDNVVVDENAGIATFTLSRTEPYTESNSVTWTLTPSANVLGNGDISGAMTGTAVFAENVSTTTVVVYLNDDAISEGDEIFNLTLSNPTAGADLDPDKTTKTLTITNDDRDVITYSVDATSKSEGDGDGWTTYTVTVNRQNPTTTVSVGWNVVETSEINLSDIVFEETSGTVEFVGTSLTTTFDIKVKTDDIGDFDKYFNLSLSNPITNDTMGAYVNTSNTTIKVDNDDPAFSVALSADSFVEGSGTSSKLVTFVVTRDGDASGAASIKWTIGADEESANPANLSDFGGYWPSGTTVFLDGETSKIIQVALAPDSTFEPSEGFSVTLSDLVSETPGARIIIDTDTAVITNDDIGVTVSAKESSVLEGNAGYSDPYSVTFDITTEGVANKKVKVYFTLEGSGLSPADEYDFLFANLGGDYNNWNYDSETNTGYVTVRTDGSGYAFTQVHVNINGDLIAGNDETFRLRVTGVEGGTVAVGQDEITILNDDTAIASIVNTTVDMKEGNSGTKVYTFEVTRSGSIIDSAELSYEIQGFGDNQATADDFDNALLPSGTVRFEAGSATATVTVNVESDTVFESDEGFIVIVGKDTLSETRLAATIQNDDSASLIFNGLVTAVKEGNNPEQQNSLSYEIIRNGDNSESLDITYYIDGDEAGTITIPAGESKVILNIPVEANTTPDADRTFDVSISADGFDSPAAIESSIIDDDAGVSIEFVGVSNDGYENEGETTTTYTFRVNRVGNNLVAETITWILAGLGINAAAESDFIATTGSVVFDATAETSDSQEFTITVASDTIVENNENFRVSISSDVEGQKVLVSSVDATIINDDVATSGDDIIYGGAGVDILRGLAGNDQIHGGLGADVLFGGAGDDTIYAEGVADVIYAGLGDDTIVVESVDFMLIDGGLGFDTLKFENDDDLTLDFANFEGEMKSIEAIDLSGSGVYKLKDLSFAAIFAINESHALYITRDADDIVDVPNDFEKMIDTVTLNTVVYDVYQATQNNDLHVNLYIHQNTIG